MTTVVLAAGIASLAVVIFFGFVSLRHGRHSHVVLSVVAGLSVLGLLVVASMFTTEAAGV